MKKILIISSMLLLFAHCTDNDLDLKEIYVPVKGLQINREAVTIVSEGERLLLANVLPGEATNQNLIWHSDDPSVASVDQNGLVTAVATFADSQDPPLVTTVTVTTEEGNFQASCEITVTPNAVIVSDPNGKVVEEIRLPIPLIPRSYQFHAEVIAPGTVSQDVVWESEDESILKVSQNGELTPIAEGTTRLNVTSTIVAAVTTSLEVKVEQIGVQEVVLSKEDMDIVLPVNVLDDTHFTQQGRLNYYTISGGFLVKNAAQQDRHLLLLKERPEQKREIVVKFTPSFPSNTDIVWEYFDNRDPDGTHPEKLLGWVALKDHDETDMPLKRPVPKMVDGQQVFTPEGNPIYVMTIPSGQYLLPKNPDKPIPGKDPDVISGEIPKSAWDVWNPYDKDGDIQNLADITFRAKSVANPDVYAEGRLEVVDYGRSVVEIANSTITTGLTPGHIVANNTLNSDRKIYAEHFRMEQLEIQIDGQWVNIPFYYTNPNANTSEYVTLRKGNLYTVRWTPEWRYMCPYVAPQRHGNTADYGIIHKGLYDPRVALNLQDCDYENGNSAWMYQTFQIWVKNANVTPQMITLRSPKYGGNQAGTMADKISTPEEPLTPECLRELYDNPDVFPRYVSSKNCAGDWLKFFVKLEN